MELVETIEAINKRLKEYFGIDTNTAQPIYRVVFSDDQLEKRLTKHTKEGFELITPVVVEIPKYKQYIQKKYILEQLVIVPPHQTIELAGEKVSYEPLWVFQDKDGNYLPPKWEACKFCIDCVNAAKGKNNLSKWLPAEHEKDDAVGQELRVQKLQEELFGNETSTGDALAHGSGISVPSTYEKKEIVH